MANDLSKFSFQSFPVNTFPMKASYNQFLKVLLVKVSDMLNSSNFFIVKVLRYTVFAFIVLVHYHYNGYLHEVFYYAISFCSASLLCPKLYQLIPNPQQLNLLVYVQSHITELVKAGFICLFNYVSSVNHTFR